jgi:hypothetical protein
MDWRSREFLRKQRIRVHPNTKVGERNGEGNAKKANGHGVPGDEKV